MELTKRRLKEIIAEEMNHLSETGDLNMITEAEKRAFAIILEKLNSKQLKELGIKRITEAAPGQVKSQEEKLQTLQNKLAGLEKRSEKETNDGQDTSKTEEEIEKIKQSIKHLTDTGPGARS